MALYYVHAAMMDKDETRCIHGNHNRLTIQIETYIYIIYTNTQFTDLCLHCLEVTRYLLLLDLDLHCLQVTRYHFGIWSGSTLFTSDKVPFGIRSGYTLFTSDKWIAYFSYVFIHLIKLLWNAFTVFWFFSSVGKLFHIRGPEYVRLCLKISLRGLGTEKLFDVIDLKWGKFVFSFLYLNISLMYGGVSSFTILNINFAFRM